jgi:L-alanine-DL-glutamate epimerase-like enolase superfamily enzyme
MEHARHQRFLAVLLAAVVLLWPVVPAPVAVAHTTEARMSAAMAEGYGCAGCDHGAVGGSCAATSCAAAPALVPTPLPDPAVARGIAFAPVDERGYGRVPGVRTPPPRTAPLA